MSTDMQDSAFDSLADLFEYHVLLPRDWLFTTPQVEKLGGNA